MEQLKKEVEGQMSYETFIPTLLKKERCNLKPAARPLGVREVLEKCGTPPIRKFIQTNMKGVMPSCYLLP